MGLAAQIAARNYVSSLENPAARRFGNQYWVWSIRGCTGTPPSFPEEIPLLAAERVREEINRLMSAR